MTVATADPSTFVRVAAQLMSKDVNLTADVSESFSQNYGRLSVTEPLPIWQIAWLKPGDIPAIFVTDVRTSYVQRILAEAAA